MVKNLDLIRGEYILSFKKIKKIAFIHYSSYGVDSTRLETMPFALNSVKALSRAGCEVDLFLWETPSKEYNDIFPSNVKIKYFFDDTRTPFNIFFKNIQLQIQFYWYRNYHCIFGVGQIGGYIASFLAKHNSAPFIYLSDEIPTEENFSSLVLKRWYDFEKIFIKKATLVVVPDIQRFAPLIQALGINDSNLIPYVELPNITIINQKIESINWHKRLGIPENNNIFLHAGSLGDWCQVPEIMSSLPYWPEESILLLHGRAGKKTTNYRKQLSHLEVLGKVFWDFEPLYESELNSLVSYCVGSFALYRNRDKNIEHIGFSSGKLMRSIACGTPVIASRSIPSLSFVESNELGVLINHPSEISGAIKKILSDRSIYNNRCQKFCKEKASFSKSWEVLCQRFYELTHIDLLKH